VLPLLLIAGCGGDPEPPAPEDAVRAAATGYVDALRDGRWADACGRMTAAGRAAVAEGRRGCERALRDVTLPRDALDTVARQVAGAPVRLSGARATLGPVGDLPEPLRFARDGDRWLVDR
jgi:hypothetical protein